MKHIISAIIVAGSLMLVGVEPAAAHESARNVYHPPSEYRVVTQRSKHAPSWLKRNDSFKWWYKHSPLQNNRYISWSELYQVYWWERSYASQRYGKSYSQHSYDWYRRNWGDNDNSDSWSRYSGNRGSDKDRKHNKRH